MSLRFNSLPPAEPVIILQHTFHVGKNFHALHA